MIRIGRLHSVGYAPGIQPRENYPMWFVLTTPPSGDAIWCRSQWPSLDAIEEAIDKWQPGVTDYPFKETPEEFE